MVDKNDETIDKTILRRSGGMAAGYCLKCKLEAERKTHSFCDRCGDVYTVLSGSREAFESRGIPYVHTSYLGIGGIIPEEKKLKQIRTLDDHIKDSFQKN